MNVCNNTYYLPEEVVCGILQHTNCHVSLQAVCKAFAQHFFEAFFQCCMNTPSLKDYARDAEIRCIQNTRQDQPEVDGLGKITCLYLKMRADIIDTSACKIESKRAMLNIRYKSIESFETLVSWLEDANLILLFEQATASIEHARTWLSDISKQDLYKRIPLKAHQIRQWLFSHAESDLSSIKIAYMSGITKLVKEAGLFINLEDLDLTCRRNDLYHDYFLICLPKEIGKLKNLKKLQLGKNKLMDFPQEITTLPQLEELQFYDNRLTILPKEISNLTHLQKLNLYGNQFKSLPQEIGNLTQLKELNLSGNELASLPQEMENLAQLQYLNLGKNCLTSLPFSIERLAHLEVVSLSENQLTDLPREIGKLSRLRELYLNQNKLTTVPKEMGNLSQLKRLSLWRNPIARLPEEFSQLFNQLDYCVIVENDIYCNERFCWYRDGERIRRKFMS